MTAKKLLASALVLIMLFSLIPMAAFATGDHNVTFVVDTSALGELNPGDVIKVPVKTTVNDGFTAFNLVAVFSDAVFEKNGSNLFTAGEDIGAGYTAGDTAYYENGDLENITTIGTMFYINLKVKEDAPIVPWSVVMAG